jgi:5'-nucleotidase
MNWNLVIPRPRLMVYNLIVGTVLVTACGWVGGSAPTPTPATIAATASPSPDSKPAAPPPVPLPSPSPSPSPAIVGDTYVVAEGDTLATIAEKLYGDPSLWRRIYEANASAIGSNPDTLRLGTTLRIPPKP